MSSPADTDRKTAALIALIEDARSRGSAGDLRERVRAFVPVAKAVRCIGTDFMPGHPSGKARMLTYLRIHAGAVIDGDELMVVAGIGEWARRVRELRVQEGWPIVTGVTVSQLREAQIEEGATEDTLPAQIRPDQYVLERDEQDLAAKEHWQTINKIRRSGGAVEDRILKLLRTYVSQPVHSEVLRYVAGSDKSEWARRTRELRTQEGWPILTKSTGDPSLPIGVYMLVRDQQAPPHDRRIPPETRGAVMKRDSYSCQWRNCGWPAGFDVRHDHRFLEIHHIHQHVDGGSNTDPDNLVTLCNHHHDEAHRSGRLDLA